MRTAETPVATVNQALQRFLVPIPSLHADPVNARRHPERNLQAVMASLATFGQQKPVVLGKGGRILAGHAMVIAATRLGWTHVAAVVYDAQRPGAFALTDNRAAELAEWSFEALPEELRDFRAELGDLERFGWSRDELSQLLDEHWPDEEPEADDGKGPAIKLTAQQYLTVQRAVVALRERRGDPKLEEGTALALLAGEWLQDPNWRGH